MSSLLPLLQVTCKKDVATEEVYFDAARRLQFPGMSADCAPGDCPRELPGWDNLRCVPSEYPSFKEPECNCLGDTHLDAEKSLQGGGALSMLLSSPATKTRDNAFYEFKSQN